MRKLCTLFSVVALATVLHAQTTAVTATITDTTGQVWFGGSYNITFAPAPGYSGPYYLDGAPFTPQAYTGTLDNTGSFAVTIPSNSHITPSGTQWQFVLCSQTTAPCSQLKRTVTGTTANFSTDFSTNVTPPVFASGLVSFGYSTAEVKPIPLPGGFFFNVTTGCQNVWNGMAWYANCSGGGGGGLTACGSANDIQIYGVPTALSCDPGVGILNPSQHLMSENTVNANLEVTVGDTTNNGLICQAHSNGSSADAAYCNEPSSTFSTTAGGYGLFPPDNAPTGANQALVVSSATPTNIVTPYGTLPFYHTEFSTAGAGVSLEYLYPVDYTNAPSPTTSNDLIRTLFPQGTSTAFMGPPPGSGQGPFVYQSNICYGTGATASCSFLGPSQKGNAYAIVVMPRGTATTTGSPTDTAGNTWTNYIGPGVSPVVAISANVAGATPSVPINTISQTFDTTYTWTMIIEEIGDVPAISPVETHANNVGGCSGSTLSFAAVMTANTDLIVGFNYTNPGGGGGNMLYSATSPWFVDQQLTLNTGGLTPYLSVAAIHGLQAAGTITPTATTANCAGETTTIAFKDGGLSTWNLPRFRYQAITDWVQQGLVPDPTAVTVGYTLGWTGNINQPFAWQAGGAGDTITSPNSTIAVGGTTTNTTLDVVGAAGKILAGATPALTYTPALGVDGSNAGTLQLANGSAAFHTILGTQATANWTFKFPTTPGTSGYVLQTDGSGNTSWASAGAGGANTALSNLATVAINTTLLPASSGSADLGSTSKPFGTAYILNALAVGSSPPTACGSATGCLALNEASTAGTPTAGQDFIRADSTTHQLLVSLNNASSTPMYIGPSQRSCEVIWGGSGTAFALSSGDDAIANNSCYNKSGLTRTITAVYCKSDAGSNTTTVNPTFGTTGTGTAICSGALTCGSSDAYSSSCTVSNASLADGSGIDPAMGGTLTGTNIHMLVVYTVPGP